MYATAFTSPIHTSKMRTKRTFENFKKAVANESKHYPSLRKMSGQFNESYLMAAFKAKQSAKACCNSMTECV